MQVRTNRIDRKPKKNIVGKDIKIVVVVCNNNKHRKKYRKTIQEGIYVILSC